MGNRQGIQLAYPYSERRVKTWFKNPNVNLTIVQPKLNGERLKWNGSMLWTSEANECVAVPHIVDQLIKYFPNKPLDGEAYVHGWTKNQISSVMRRTVNLHPDYAKMQFHVFDVPTQDKTQLARTSELLQDTTFKQTESIIQVPTHIARTHAQIEAFVIDKVHEGYEGCIVRHPFSYYTERRVNTMLKWKPGGEDDYKLIAMIEGQGQYEGTLGSMKVMGSNGQTFNVGSFETDKGMNMETRKELWAQKDILEGKAWVRVRYTELTERGVPPSGVYKFIVRK